jgi:hydroxymethylpyrimidine/phosphomethylpyrimidine kinase
MSIVRVLTIAGSDSGGGAGIQADLKTITVLGAFGMSVVTALTAQNTRGVWGIHKVPPAFVAAQFDAVATDIGVDAAKTGMIASRSIIRIVAAKIREYGIQALVVDPVMVAKGGASLMETAARNALVSELIPLARVITPNIPEAEVLTGIVIRGKEDMIRAAEAIAGMGARSVVIKGGHLEGEATDLLYENGECRMFSGPRLRTTDTHGTGCTFSAALAVGLGKGKPVAEAVAVAKRYVTEAIRHSLRLGGGNGPTNHLAPLWEGRNGEEGEGS